MSKRNSISFTEDIKEEWCKRTGKSRELIDDMYAWHIKYVKKLTRETPDAVNVRLPGLGVLRMNFYMALRYTTLYDKKNEVLNSKISLLEKTIREHGWYFINFNKPMIMKMHWLMFKNTGGGILKNFYNIFKKVEDVTNEEYNKKHSKK